MAQSGQKKPNDLKSQKKSSNTADKSKLEESTEPHARKNGAKTGDKATRRSRKSRLSPAVIQIISQIILALITGTTTIITALLASPILVPLLESITAPQATPTAVIETPVPYARVQTLDVLEDGKLIDTINPGGDMLLAAGYNVNLRVNVITNESLDDLVFHWEFCQSGKNTKGQGAIEIPYISGAAGADCIRVKIEKGGQYLEDVNFLVSITNNPPE